MPTFRFSANALPKRDWLPVLREVFGRLISESKLSQWGAYRFIFGRSRDHCRNL
jgi:hypothetical protein